MTSKWVRMVAAQRDYRVDWRFISLRILNAHIDYDGALPAEYEEGHTAGLRLLRVAAQGACRTRPRGGRPAVRGDRHPDLRHLARRRSAVGVGPGRAARARAVVAVDVGLPTDLADALDDADARRRDPRRDRGGAGADRPRRRHPDPALPAARWHGVLRPGDQQAAVEADEAVELWDHVVALAAFPGFAEIKRSLRERPQLASFGVDAEAVGKEEDWHGGSRRIKK